VTHLWNKDKSSVINIIRHIPSEEGQLHCIDHLHLQSGLVPLIEAGWEAVNARSFEWPYLKQGIPNLLLGKFLA
jgi:hypothetical protein